MYPHHVFNLEPAGTFGMYPICYRQVSGRYFQPEPAMYSRCFCWFPGPLAPSDFNCGFSDFWLQEPPKPRSDSALHSKRRRSKCDWGKWVPSIIHVRNFCCTDWTSNIASMFSIFYQVLATDVFAGGNYTLSSHSTITPSSQSASSSSVRPYGVSSPSSATFKPCTNRN